MEPDNTSNQRIARRSGNTENKESTYRAVAVLLIIHKMHSNMREASIFQHSGHMLVSLLYLFIYFLFQATHQTFRPLLKIDGDNQLTMITTCILYFNFRLVYG
jgi:uncharacterized MAPEG superfamily protein